MTALLKVVSSDFCKELKKEILLLAFIYTSFGRFNGLRKVAKLLDID
jgi:hypothetical protein